MDALIGGGVALIVGQVLFPRDRCARSRGRPGPLPRTCRSRSRTCAEALAAGDEERARRALELARAVDEDLAAFFDAVAIARETLPVLPGRRPRERLPVYAEAAQQMDYAVRNTRVLARRAIATVRRHGAAPPRLAEAGACWPRPSASWAAGWRSRGARSPCAGWR